MRLFWFYPVVKVLLRVLLFLLTRRQVKGRGNVPNQGSLIIVSNHLNNIDPPLLGVSLDRKVIFMAKQELFRSGLSSYFLRGFGAFPVHRERMDRKALRQADQVLAQGLALVLFPEGKRSRHAQLLPALAGSAVIAVRSGAPILPIGISGTEKIKGVSWLWRRPQIKVNIGHPFYLPPVSGRLVKAEVTELTDSVMGHIAELLPAKYRGNYAK